MGLSVVFELDDDDLKHFQLIMKEACAAASGMSPEDIVAAAQDLLDSIGDRSLPGFIAERLERLRNLIDMVQDHEWGLPDEDRRRVLNALAYFCEHEDLIPDSIPGLGYLDDAIMIELAVRELGPEIEAYRDFCEFRQSESARRGVKAKSTDVTREDWLRDRREKLQKRMRKRRLKLGGGDGSGSPFRLM
ncbi:MAG: YkvA family protein [Woeseiaceae bacterium]|nr:YkvA family protein [Woeseiaceae bacterium]